MRVKKSLPLLAIAIALFVAAPVNAQKATNPNTVVQTSEWLQFRGPNGMGVAEGATLPAEFNA